MMITIGTCQLCFALFCISTWGSEITTPLITDKLPAGQICWWIKIIFGFTLLINYQLLLVPAHTTIEKHLYSSWAPSRKRYWFKNLNRTLFCVLLTVFTISLDQHLTKFLSIMGALSMTP